MNGNWCVVVDWDTAYLLPPNEKPTRLPAKFWQGQTPVLFYYFSKV